MKNERKRWYWLNKELLANQYRSHKKTWFWEEKDKNTYYIANDHTVFVVPKAELYLNKNVIFSPNYLSIKKRIISLLDLSAYQTVEQVKRISIGQSNAEALELIASGITTHINYKDIKPLFDAFWNKELVFSIRDEHSIIICFYRNEPIAYFCPIRITNPVIQIKP